MFLNCPQVKAHWMSVLEQPATGNFKHRKDSLPRESFVGVGEAITTESVKD